MLFFFSDSIVTILALGKKKKSLLECFWEKTFWKIPFWKKTNLLLVTLLPIGYDVGASSFYLYKLMYLSASHFAYEH